MVGSIFLLLAKLHCNWWASTEHGGGIFIGRFIISVSSDLFLSACGFIFHYNSWKYNLLNLFLIYLSLFSFNYFPNLFVFDVFLCRIVFISLYCQSCDLWDLVFVHMFFVFSYPQFLTYDISVLFHGSIDHASTITSYVSIVMEFLTSNVMWGHIGISFIIPAIYNLMSKVSTIKTMNIK